MVSSIKSIALSIMCLNTITFSVYGQIGQFEQHSDVGDCAHQGFVNYNDADQSYTIGASGENMWGEVDAFHYLWNTLQGDFILRAEIKWKGKGVHAHRKAGWIVKNDLRASSKHVNASIHGDGLTSLQYRNMDGGETEQIVLSNDLPDVVQLERRGSQFIMSTAKFGQPFEYSGSHELTMDEEVYIGLYVCSHDNNIVETATFRNVRIIKPVDPDFQPYRDYIGSNLEILNIETGVRKIIHRSAHSIQAPNWTMDGSKLIYNSKGLLYTFDLNSGKIKQLPSGFATNNNNDHVLSFDGEHIGISHGPPEEDGRSTIYIMPVTGSDQPKQITKPGAGYSYLHGWSPDKKLMVFTGNRKGQYDIYTVDIESGEEKQLTDFSSVDDGPEYSKDGKYIYFNSSRSGTMQLYRMGADGSDVVQLTNDSYNDWFPHISPDQKTIVFISFPSDINPDDHPFYKQCLIRKMPVEGGDIAVIGYIYGGQGTINVPSWSPDGKYIAFVTNTKY